MLMGLKSVQGLLKEKTVQVLSDNVTKVAFSEHMGETQKQLDSVARAIYILAIDLKITLKAGFVSRKSNWRADQLSRLSSTYKWMLHPRLFLMIDHVGAHITWIGSRK